MKILFELELETKDCNLDELKKQAINMFRDVELDPGVTIIDFDVREKRDIKLHGLALNNYWSEPE